MSLACCLCVHEVLGDSIDSNFSLSLTWNTVKDNHNPILCLENMCACLCVCAPACIVFSAKDSAIISI